MAFENNLIRNIKIHSNSFSGTSNIFTHYVAEQQQKEHQQTGRWADGEEKLLFTLGSALTDLTRVRAVVVLPPVFRRVTEMVF